MLKVVSDDVSGKVIRNEACISKDTDKNGNEVDDRDSKPEEWPGRKPDHKYEDDEDYDNVILSTFDIALRKFIVATGKNEKIEKKDYLTNSDGTYQREPVVDTSKLNTVGEELESMYLINIQCLFINSHIRKVEYRKNWDVYDFKVVLESMEGLGNKKAGIKVELV